MKAYLHRLYYLQRCPGKVCMCFNYTPYDATILDLTVGVLKTPSFAGISLYTPKRISIGFENLGVNLTVSAFNGWETELNRTNCVQLFPHQYSVLERVESKAYFNTILIDTEITKLRNEMSSGEKKYPFAEVLEYTLAEYENPIKPFMDLIE